MKKVIKWLLIAGGAFVALIIVALLVIPMFVDIQKYKPEIEKMVSEATGRPFAIGGNLDLSLFPWAGISFSDLHLGNPPGFEEKELLSVAFFEMRVKLIPLISKDIQVKRFILEGPRIVVERSKRGRTNLEGLWTPPAEAPPKPSKEKAKEPVGGPGEGLPIKGLAVGEFAITKGSLLWIDHINEERREVSDLSLHLQDVSLDRPIQLALLASLDGHPLSLKGRVGPMGKEPGKGILPLELAVKALKQLEMDLKGEIVDPASRQEFEMAIELSPFSPRRLLEALGQDLPLTPADPEALNTVALKARLKGNPKSISISDGTLELDDSKCRFSVEAKDFSQPAVSLDLTLDRINLDRYFPPPSDKAPDVEKKKAKAPPTPKPPARKKTDYTPLRKLVLDAEIRVGELKAHGARTQDLYLKVSGKEGLFRFNPLTLKLYQGDVSSKGTFDVRQETPKSNMALQAQGIQVNPLLKDLLNKDFIEGTAKATVNIAVAGDEPEKMKATLNGRGDFLFRDGAVKGIDLEGMVRNVKAAFGLAEREEERPRTDFSELHLPFMITNGVVNTPKTSLVSPLIRVLASGKADMVKETLDFRVEPKFVGTLKGQGDTAQYGGITVPVLVTGSFSSPKFRPDLKGLLKQRLEKALPKPSELEKILSGQKEKVDEGSEPEPVKEKVKDLLKSLPFGR